MKTALLKSKKTAKKQLSSFKMKAQLEEEALDSLISGLMGNCHNHPEGTISCPNGSHCGIN